MKLEFQIRVEDFNERRVLYLTSPDVPGLHLLGETLPSILGEAGRVVERLIDMNNVEALKPLLSREGGGSNG